jgi:hypothetical protein
MQTKKDVLAWGRAMALVAAELSVAAQDGLGLSVALDKRFWELIRSHPDLTINGEVTGIMTKSNASVRGGAAAPYPARSVGTEPPHPMLCFQHGGSEACEAENRKHGFTCPKCSNKRISEVEDDEESRQKPNQGRTRIRPQSRKRK